MIYVLYHASCLDGAGARLAAWLKFGDEARYKAVQYKQPLPSDLNGSLDNSNDEVYILDFSYPKDILEELKTRVKSLVVLDHHKTAMDDLKDLDYAIFDMNKSGATLAWNYFHADKPVPNLFRYIEDRDLWKFDLDHTREICSYAMMYMYDNRILNGLIDDVEDINSDSYIKVVSMGSSICLYEDKQIESSIKKAKLTTYKGYKIALLNLTSLISQTGEALYEQLPIDFSITYFITNDGKVVLSFRSKGDMDVSVLAKELGGGGHKNACGAVVDFDFLKQLLQ